VRLSLNIPGQRRKLGEILVEESFITEEELKAALAEQRVTASRRRLGTLLMERGLISAAQFMLALSTQLTVVRPFGPVTAPLPIPVPRPEPAAA
jgi:hypothetical protein